MGDAEPKPLPEYRWWSQAMEAAGGIELYRRYADVWRGRQPTATQPGDFADEPPLRYVLDCADVRLVFLSAESGGIVLSDDEIAWAAHALAARPDIPSLLFTHAPAPGIFAAAGARTLKNPNSTQLQGIANLRLWFSGHTHFNLDEVEHVQVDAHGVAHVHVPEIERTKVGTVHVPRLRLVEVDAEKRRVVVETFNIETERFEPEHRAEFPLVRAR